MPQIPAEYGGHSLDEFQVDAIIRLQQSASILVSAPTGTGKTLIADFLIEQALHRGEVVYYTAPIKALVNQKYRDFLRRFGKHRCGMMTGDVTLHPDADVIAMTTEVLRNRLLRGNDDRNVRWVVFDEFHYLGHPERGAAWELSLLLLPPGVRVVGLSATVPNIDSLAVWLQEAIADEVYPIVHTERAVPLRHYFFTEQGELILQSEAWERVEGYEPYEDEEDDSAFREHAPRRLRRGAGRRVSVPDHLQLVRLLGERRLFPCIYFDFSRRECEKKAAQLAHRRDFLSPHEKESVWAVMRQVLDEARIEAASVPKIDELRRQWMRGIGVHHAGLLPVVRRIVERLLERRLLRIVYATETFAVGVNMPVRTVCFASLEKYDGRRFRLLTAEEYFQMAGRAGRRGHDRIGTVIASVSLAALAEEGLPEWDESSLPPVRSALDLSFAVVLNLFARFDLPQIARLLQRSLTVFEAESRERALIRLFRLVQSRLEALRRLGYIGDGRLQAKGEFCRNVWVKELLVTEMSFDGSLDRLTPAELAGWAGAIVWEPRALPGEWMPAAPRWASGAHMAQQRLRSAVPGLEADAWLVEARVAPLMEAWAQGQTVDEVLQGAPLEPGDFVALCRQALDLLRQVASAAPDATLRDRLSEAIEAVDRDVVAAGV